MGYDSNNQLKQQELLELLIKYNIPFPRIFYHAAIVEYDLKSLKLILDNSKENPVAFYNSATKKITISAYAGCYSYAITLLNLVNSSYQTRNLRIDEILKLHINFGMKILMLPEQIIEERIEVVDMINDGRSIDKIYYASTIQELTAALCDPINPQFLTRLINLCRKEGVPQLFNKLLSSNKEATENEITGIDFEDDEKMLSSKPNKKIKIEGGTLQINEGNRQILNAIIERQFKEESELLNHLESEIGCFLAGCNIISEMVPYRNLKADSVTSKFYQDHPEFKVANFLDHLRANPAYLYLHKPFADILFSFSYCKLLSEEKDKVSLANKPEFFESQYAKSYAEINKIQDEKIAEPNISDQLYLESNERLINPKLRGLLNHLRCSYTASPEGAERLNLNLQRLANEQTNRMIIELPDSQVSMANTESATTNKKRKEM